jgi:hypothetical protein
MTRERFNEIVEEIWAKRQQWDCLKNFPNWNAKDIARTELENAVGKLLEQTGNSADEKRAARITGLIQELRQELLGP